MFHSEREGRKSDDFHGHDSGQKDIAPAWENVHKDSLDVAGNQHPDRDEEQHQENAGRQKTIGVSM